MRNIFVFVKPALLEHILDPIVSLLIFIDGLLYDLVGNVFDIFNFFATFSLFDNDTYKRIINRIYIILGLIMLFALSYSLLRAVINPDEFSKGETTFPKLIKNVVISLIIITILPTIFQFATNIQKVIINQNTIPQIILGEDACNEKKTTPGKIIAYHSFTSFFYPSADKCDSDDIDKCAENISSSNEESKASESGNAANYKKISDDILNGKNVSFAEFNRLTYNVVEGEITYIFLVSTIFGGFLLWVIANFCFDMAVRVIKLMFFEIIAPIPVVCRIIPGGKFKDVFSTWLKKIISTFLDVFIRVFILYVSILAINVVATNFANFKNLSSFSYTFCGTTHTLNWGQAFAAKALIIMGVVVFMKQAPKLIGDLFHLDTGDMKLGLMDKLAMGGGLVAASAVGSGLGTMTRNAVNKFANKKNWQNADGKTTLGSVARNLGSGLLSMGTGAVAGAGRGFMRGRGAKNFGDVRKATDGAIGATIEARDQRAKKYKSYRQKNPGSSAIDTALGVTAGGIIDKVSRFGESLGFGSSIKELQEEQTLYQDGMKYKKELFDLVADNETVKAYQGMSKSAQDRDINNYVSEIEKEITAAGYSTRDSVGYFKLDSATGQKSYFKDSSGNVMNDLTALAISRKAADIKKYDDAVKLASLNAIAEKVNKGDGRFTAVFKKSEVWREQNSDNSTIASLSALQNLDSSQINAINSALASNDSSKIKQVLDAFEGDATAMSALGISSLGIMANDKKLKAAKSVVEEAIAEKIEEKKKDDKKGN